ncbi:hypothetical protein DEU56DRAFT_279552 [Suillus clintonianus]|uniref:uncharacterized protein n=1 Tax=Suillus clintonianus TaxID=1904413 RepID=UPI001B86A43A|nr:uncharacterized protein DEU56DRAFT_279552 [Suillus clintonianus]KAG2141006.1 hypothetical protein DEU56DRAFT_279552 [Suillus clintonianus]
MAPNFFSKLVRPTPSSPSGRENTTASPRPSIPARPHSQSLSYTPSSLLDLASDNSSTKGSVKIGIIPPSPRSALSVFPDSTSQDHPHSDTSQHRRARSQERMVADRHAVSFAARPMASDTSLSSDDVLPTPTPSRSRPEEWKKTSADSSPRPFHQLSPASSTGNLKAFVDKRSTTVPPNAHKVVERAPSKQSLRSRTQPPAPLEFDHPQHDSSRPDTSRRAGRHEHNAVIIEKGLVDSPTAISHSRKSSHPQELLPTLTDPDARSIRSVTSSDSKKKKGWRRPSLTTPTRKQSGIASAIVASGLAMTNAGPQMSPVPPIPISASKVTSGTVRSNGSARSAVRHAASSSMTSVPGSVDASSTTRYVSSSRDDFSDGQTDTFASSEDSEASDDELDINEDIPVTGFAVASSKRNADFHELFPSIPEGDYLIEDYGCALQREILIQGRIYISENHICFHANIFGWITDLSIPIYEITALEKKMTAFVIPNAIQITTRQAKYTFASFLSRDTTYDVIANIWRLARPEEAFTDSHTGSSGNIVSPASTSDVSGPVVISGGKEVAPVTRTNKVTACACSKSGGHLNEIALETVLPGTPDKIYNLMFASGFIKDFMRVDQKLMDVQISDWSPTGDNLKLLARNMSYIKPLNNSVGPKQTKCEIHDETLTCDFDDYVVMLTTTKTPDVPSGGVFLVKTRTCIMWASSISTRVIVSTQVDWTGRSFIKGLIEKSAIDGQKVYHSDLDKAMRMYIQEHQSEFIPAGVDPTAVAPVEPLSPVMELNSVNLLSRSLGISDEEARRAREHERNRRGLQWAYDTFDGAYGVAKRSTFGALELVKEAWEQSSSMTILYFVIVILVFSNLWTLMLVGQREEAGRRKEARKTEEREKWVQDVVTGLWEEMSVGRARGPSGGVFGAGVGGGGGGGGSGPVGGDWRSEVDAITTTLNAVEERVRLIRESLDTLN